MVARAPARGFTLIELMMVVAVIGLLVMLIVPAVTKATQMLQTSHTEQMLKDISIGLEAFRADFRCYPPSKPYDAANPTDPTRGRMSSGAANLALYLRGPVGGGWGTTAGGLMPFGGRAGRAFGPYYNVEEAGIAYDTAGTLAGFLDPLRPAGLNADDKVVGRVLYFLAASDGTFAWDDNRDPDEVDATKQAYMGYVSTQQFAKSAATSGAKRYLLVSPGFDRRYGLLYKTAQGVVVPDADGTATDTLPCDDIQYVR